MFQHILVPLDGSSRAEQALPLAAHIARRTGGTITLLQVIPHESGNTIYAYSRAGVLADEFQIALMQEARGYLERIAHTEPLAGIGVQTRVTINFPVQEILSYAESEHADLIVLCRHGFTGLKRWVMGSVAQKIVRHSPVPVLVLSEKDLESPLVHPEQAQPIRAMVALDGSPLAESILLPAAQLVAALSPAETTGELHMLRILKPPGDQEERGYLAHDIDIRQFYRREAEQYLSLTKAKLTKELPADVHVQLTSDMKEDADVATALIGVAESGYALMALATHGRSDLKRWMVGSIAERVLEKATMPLLIMRPSEQHQSS
jgi:nucleotide-binding universal stress UspA family protein